MKHCPTCNQTYDDSLSFCLMDGTPLATDSEVKTVVMQRPVARKKSRYLLWTALAGLIILAGSGLLLGFLFYNYSGQNDSVQGKRQRRVNVPSSQTPPTAKTATTPASAKSSPVEDSSPTVEESTPTPNDEDSEDITPIDWETTASGFKGEPGQTYKFRCPEEGTENYIWGSDVYTHDSSICTAAIHAGKINLAQGGVVTIEIRPGRLTYGSTVRNGVKSKTYGEHPRSFAIR